METLALDWTHSNNWDLTDEINHTSGGVVSWYYDTNSASGYDTGAPNAGYLTSPPINLPANGGAFLDFWYYYETESSGINWDQRWVQISVNNGPFTNIHQLSDDQTRVWLRSPAISLATYAGSSVRIRFYFVTLDGLGNQYKGWYIDDISINLVAPPDCLDMDNTIANATLINYGSSQFGLICAGGDVDYYKFQGVAGDRVGIRVDASTMGSTLDSYLTLYDNDGLSLLAENDDQVLYEQTDSFISYLLLRTGTYYIKIKSWDHPTSGSPSAFYTLHLYQDNQDPTASIIFPQDGQNIIKGPFQLSVNAADTQTGISYVDFLWHSPDWQSANWQVIGQDWDGSDGWSMPFDTSQIDIANGIAIYARVYDQAGNWIGLGAYNLRLPGVFLPMIVK